MVRSLQTLSRTLFLFFDTGDLPTPLANAHLYVNGITDAKGAELMYFEIQLGK